MIIKRYELTDEQRKIVEPQIQHTKMGRPAKDDRTVVNAILWMTRSGTWWEDLPERYGSWKTVYSRFRKWRDDGTFQCIFQTLNADANMENLSLMAVEVLSHINIADSTILADKAYAMERMKFWIIFSFKAQTM